MNKRLIRVRGLAIDYDRLESFGFEGCTMLFKFKDGSRLALDYQDSEKLYDDLCDIIKQDRANSDSRL
jgi:hypothetical protein